MGKMDRVRRTIPHSWAVIGVALILSCASAPRPDPQSATIWGYVRLVPKKDVPGAGGGYGDRRLADVKRFDYSHPHYAVVYAPKSAATNLEPVELRIRAGRGGHVMDPPIAFASPEAGLSIRNETNEDQVVSAPALGWIARVEAGGVRHLDAAIEGELTLHVLGGGGNETARKALVWISPGAMVRVEPSGRYVLDGLAPGTHELRAWHPRLPPTRAIALDLTKGEVHREDLAIGVDVGDIHVEETR